MIIILFFISLLDFDKKIILIESFNDLKIEVESNNEKILKTHIEKDNLFIISNSNDNYYLNINNNYHFGKYISKKNGFAFFKVKLNKLIYLIYSMKLISPFTLKKIVTFKYKIKLLFSDIYRVYKGRKSRIEILKIAKTKMKSENLIIMMKENFHKKHKHYYWTISSELIPKYRENISFSGIMYLEIDSITGKIVNFGY